MMTDESKRRHLFISHHHKDDGEVTKLTNLLTSKGYDIRNSSIRANRQNQERLDKKLVPEKVLKRLLRLKISWSSTVVVLIGAETHGRPWVNWEIETAHEQGKRIVGVYKRGGTEADLPESLKKYCTSLVGWNHERIIDAIDGTDNIFQNPDGSASATSDAVPNVQC